MTAGARLGPMATRGQRHELHLHHRRPALHRPDEKPIRAEPCRRFSGRVALLPSNYPGSPLSAGRRDSTHPNRPGPGDRLRHERTARPLCIAMFYLRLSGVGHVEGASAVEPAFAASRTSTTPTIVLRRQMDLDPAPSSRQFYRWCWRRLGITDPEFGKQMTVFRLAQPALEADGGAGYRHNTQPNGSKIILSTTSFLSPRSSTSRTSAEGTSTTSRARPLS